MLKLIKKIPGDEITGLPLLRAPPLAKCAVTMQQSFGTYAAMKNSIIEFAIPNSNEQSKKVANTAIFTLPSHTDYTVFC